MNLYLFESKKRLKSAIIWSVSIVACMFLFMAIYPSFAADAETMESILAHYPEEMLKAFGMDTALPMTSIGGYMVFTFVFIELFLAIQAANLGFGVLSEEERDLTADFLMTKPISRTRIILGKVSAALTAIILTNIATWGSTFLTIELFNDGNGYEPAGIAWMLSSVFFFQLFYLAVGMLVSVSVKKVRSVLSYSMAIAFGTYILNALKGVLGGDTLGYFTPFYHFEVSYIIINQHYNWSSAVISFVVIAIGFVGTYILYTKRNIHSL